MNTERMRELASRRWKAADAELAWKVYGESGMSMSAFCKKTSVKRGRMDWWKAKFREAACVGGAVFHPVRVVDAVAAPKWVADVMVNGCHVLVPFGFVEEELGRLLAVVRGDDL